MFTFHVKVGDTCHPVDGPCVIKTTFGFSIGSGRVDQEVPVRRKIFL